MPSFAHPLHLSTESGEDPSVCRNPFELVEMLGAGKIHPLWIPGMFV